MPTTTEAFWLAVAAFGLALFALSAMHGGVL